MRKKKDLMARRSQLLDAERTQLERLQAEELGLDGTEDDTYRDRCAEIERLDNEIGSLERMEGEISARAAGSRGAASTDPFSGDWGAYLRGSRGRATWRPSR